MSLLTKKPNIFNLNRSLSILGGLCLSLLISSLVLKGQIKRLKNKSAQNIEALNQALPGFNQDSLSQLKNEIGSLETSLKKIASLFDIKGRWVVKDYDLSIYFVDELDKVNQALKKKAKERNVDYPGLGFPEQLPSETNAVYLLSQLNSLKEIVNLGMEYGASFIAITPLSLEKETGVSKATKEKDEERQEEKKEAIAGIRLLGNHIEMMVPQDALSEFLIQLHQLVPKVFWESFLLKEQDTNFKTDFMLTQVVIDADWKDTNVPTPLESVSIVSVPGEDYAQLLRSNSPFPVIKATTPSMKQVVAQTEEPKEKIRFFYRGKAILQSREVAVIEDTLNGETLFLSQGERIGNFLVKEFSEGEAVLANTENNAELTIKKE